MTALRAEGRIGATRRVGGQQAGGLAVGWPWLWGRAGQQLRACASSSSHRWMCNGHTEATQPQGRLHSHCGSCWHTLGSSSWQENPNSLLPSALVPFPAAWHSLEATWNSGAASVLTLCHSEHPAVGTVRALMQHSLVSGDLWQTAEEEGAGRDYFVFSPQLYQPP